MRPEKLAITKEVRERLEGSRFVLFIDYMGLTVQQLSNLRARMSEADANVQVVKNVFLERAFLELGWDGASLFRDGPTAIVAGSGDITRTVRALRTFIRENNALGLKGGRLGTILLSPANVAEIADIPSREALLGKLTSTCAAPLMRLLWAVSQKTLSLLYVLKAIEEKKKQSG